MASTNTLTEESWRQERFDTYLNISQDVQNLHELLRKAASRIMDLRRGNKSIDISGTAVKIFAHNAAHYDDQRRVNLKTIESLDVAGKVFEEGKKQVNESFEILCSEKAEKELEAFSDVEGLEDARTLLRKIVEQDLVAWEKRVGEVASVASMLTA